MNQGKIVNPNRGNPLVKSSRKTQRYPSLRSSNRICRGFFIEKGGGGVTETGLMRKEKTGYNCVIMEDVRDHKSYVNTTAIPHIHASRYIGASSLVKGEGRGLDAKRGAGGELRYNGTYVNSPAIPRIHASHTSSTYRTSS